MVPVGGHFVAENASPVKGPVDFPAIAGGTRRCHFLLTTRLYSRGKNGVEGEVATWLRARPRISDGPPSRLGRCPKNAGKGKREAGLGRLRLGLGRFSLFFYCCWAWARLF